MKANTRYNSVQSFELSEGLLESSSMESTVDSPVKVVPLRRGDSLRPEERRQARLNGELLDATLDGSLSRAQTLIDSGASPDATCRQSGVTACHIAGYFGHLELLKLFITSGAEVDRKDKLGRQPIHYAAWAGNCVAIQLFHACQRESGALDAVISERKEQIDRKISDSWTHQHNSVSFLVPDDLVDGSTPLHLACRRLNTDCVNYLVAAGANVEILDDKGQSPIDVVGLDRKDDRPQQQEPLTNTMSLKSDLWHPTRWRSGLQATSQEFYSTEEESNNRVLGIISTLMEKGARLTRPPPGAKPLQTPTTCLHTAVENEDLELIEYLLNKNACILTWNEAGDTPLHLAVRRKALATLKKLLCHSNDSRKINARDPLGRTPLHLAIILQWPEGVSLLLEMKADVKATTNRKENVLHLGAESGNPDILEDLLSVEDSIKVLEERNSFSMTPLTQAVYNDHLHCAKILVLNGADVLVVLPGETSLLHVAAGIDSVEMIKFLSGCGLQDSWSLEERGGRRAMHIAAARGSSQCVDAFLRSGGDLLAKTLKEPDKSSTALHLAALGNHAEAIETILKYDKEKKACYVVDGRGLQPIHVAALRGNGNAVKSLIKGGADLSATYKDPNLGTVSAFDLICNSVPQPINLLEEILDTYITVNEFPINDPKCEIDVKYDVLMPRGVNKRQMLVLTALLNTNKSDVQEKILLHPIVETFLTLKWWRLRYFFFGLFTFYLLLTISVTFLAMMKYVDESLPKIVREKGDLIAPFLLAVTSFPVFFVEILNLIQLQKYYLRDLESWVRWSFLIGLWCVCLVSPQGPYGRYIAGITVLLGWTELLFLIARYPNWGYYVLMFAKVATNLLKVLASFLFLLLGFTLSFMIIFDASGPFSTLWLSFTRVMSMMSEPAFTDTFPDDAEMSPALSVTGRAVFIIFVILVGVVLTNLMVGLAVSDITVLESHGRTQRLAKQIDFLNLMEMVVHSKIFSFCCLPSTICRFIQGQRYVEQSTTFRPGAPLKCVFRSLPDPVRKSIMEKVIQKKIQTAMEEEVALVHLDSKLDRILGIIAETNNGKNKMDDKLNEIKREIIQIKNRLDQVPRLESSIEHRPIGFEPSLGRGEPTQFTLI